jgi:hypothetical protein
MASIPRILAVTAGLIMAGVVAGAVAAGCALALSLVLLGEWRAAVDFGFWKFAGAVGAVIGGVAAPVTAWLFMRHVPLGRMIAQTTLATIVFGGVGFAMHLNPFFAAPAGFLAAAARLAIVTPRRRLSPGTDQSNLVNR